MTGDEGAEDTAARDHEVLRLRENGATWLEIQRAMSLTRQQARHAYQKAKRQERRAKRQAT